MGMVVQGRRVLAGTVAGWPGGVRVGDGRRNRLGKICCYFLIRFRF